MSAIMQHVQGNQGISPASGGLRKADPAWATESPSMAGLLAYKMKEKLWLLNI